MTTTQKFSPETRKALVKALAEILETKATYLGVPSCAYQIGDFYLAKDGALTGPELFGLLTALHERGFDPVAEEADPAPEAEEAPVVVSTAADPISEPAAELAPELKAPAELEPDQVVIEVPLADFTPEALDRLAAMVTAKEALIKKALNVDSLPIQILSDRIAFPWFTSTDGAEVNAYAQFITALANTARGKKRVTAKAPADGFGNEAFAMRVFLIGLGLIGPEYKLARALLGKGLDGNSGWRYGPPEKTPALAPEDSCE